MPLHHVDDWVAIERRAKGTPVFPSSSSSIMLASLSPSAALFPSAISSCSSIIGRCVAAIESLKPTPWMLRLHSGVVALFETICCLPKRRSRLMLCVRGGSGGTMACCEPPLTRGGRVSRLHSCRRQLSSQLG